MCLRLQGRIRRIRAVLLGVLIGIAVVGSLIVWTNEGVYTTQTYVLRFNAGKKTSLFLVVSIKGSMVCQKAHNCQYSKNANSTWDPGVANILLVQNIPTPKGLHCNLIWLVQ